MTIQAAFWFGISIGFLAGSSLTVLVLPWLQTVRP